MLISLSLDSEKLNRGFVDILKAQEIATKNTLNTMAFLVRKNSIKNIKSEFITRNNFTERQIRVEKVNSDSLNFMFSEVGASEKAEYMQLQEEGGTKKPKKGNKLAIPQNLARGGSNKNLVQKKLYLSKIKRNMVKNTIQKGTYRSKLVARAYMAKKLNKFLNHSGGIFQIKSFSKSKNSVHFVKNLIYNTKQSQVKIHPRKWFEPALQQPVKDAQNIYNSQIGKLLRQKEII